MDNTKHIFTVAPSDNGKRLDKYLAEQTGLSREFVKGLVKKPSYKVLAGEVIEVEIPPKRSLDLTPWDFPLDVIFENDDLLVINKPIGLTVHPAPGNWEKTLVHAVLHHCKGGLSGINGVERPGIVHRLDKDTSGLMVIAKNDATHRRLAGQIESREIKRIYTAFICGMPPSANGIVEADLGRDPKSRVKMAVVEHGGKSAVTEYEIIKIYQKGLATKLECRLQTGRTHQIRVHMQHIGCPIIGDTVYVGRNRQRMIETAIGELPNRQALHASKLIIPDVGEFEADLPNDLQELENKLYTQ